MSSGPNNSPCGYENKFIASMHGIANWFVQNLRNYPYLNKFFFNKSEIYFLFPLDALRQLPPNIESFFLVYQPV